MKQVGNDMVRFPLRSEIEAARRANKRDTYLELGLGAVAVSLFVFFWVSVAPAMV